MSRMNHSQYCLGSLRGDTFKESARRTVGIDRDRFESILTYIHERDPKEFTDILTARRFCFFYGTDKEYYAKFLRWILRQEAGKLSREQLHVFDRLMKK